MNKQESIGAVVGRFQVDDLHEGHRHTIDTAAKNHDTLVIFVGYNDVRIMPGNEMPVAMRIAMVQQAYPNAMVLPLPDSKIGNQHWSESLDRLLRDLSAGADVFLYGSRDSFIPYYTGRYTTVEVAPLSSISATAIRAEFNSDLIKTAAERRAWMTAIRSQFPVTDSVVDIAIVSADWKRVLLGRRGEQGGLRFFGGFLDSTDASDAVAARREQTEEVVNVEVSDPVYIGSRRVDDPRYRNNGQGWGVMTRFHVSVYESGDPAGSDDIELVEWADLKSETISSLVLPHQELFEMLLDKQREMQQIAA